MKKRLFVALITILGANPFSNAQKNYVEGLVVLLNGDTLKGLIDDQKWEKNPVKISFRSSRNEDFTYSASEISLFKTVQGSYFKSAITTIDKSPTKLDKIERSEMQSYTVRDSVFLEVLILGRCNLYYLMDEQAKRHYFIEKDGEIKELIQKLVVTETGESDVSRRKIVSKIDIYKRQLNEMLYDCPFVKEKIPKVKLDRASTMRIIGEYNTCKDSKSSYVKTEKTTVLEFGAVAGLAVTNINFSGTVYLNLINTDFPNSYSPTGGIWLNLTTTKNRQRISLYNEVTYRSYHLQGTYNASRVTTYEANMSYLKINSAFRYQYPKWNAKPFLQGGACFGFGLKKDTPIPSDISKTYEQGLWIGTGLRISNYGTEFRYEVTDGFSGIINLASPVKTLYILLSYKF